MNATISSAPARGQTALEDDLELCRRTVRKALATAEGIDRKKDIYGQDIAYKRAMDFLKMSAMLGLALAKLKGEHTSNIRVHKTETAEPPAPLELPVRRQDRPLLARRSPDPERAARIDKIYNDWLASRSAAKDDGAQAGDDDDDAEDETGEGDTPHLSAGSNDAK